MAISLNIALSTQGQLPWKVEVWELEEQRVGPPHELCSMPLTQNILIFNKKQSNFKYILYEKALFYEMSHVQNIIVFSKVA